MGEDNAGGGANLSLPRRWRRVCLAAGSVLAAGGLVFGGAMIAVVTRPSARHAPRAVIGWYAPSTVYPSTPTVILVPASPTPAAGPAMTTAQILAALRGMLPPASAMSYVEGISVGGETGVASQYNDGQGNVAFSIDIMPSYLGPPAFPMNCSNPFGNPSLANVPAPPGGVPPSCVMRNLPDGSTERDVVTPLPRARLAPTTTRSRCFGQTALRLSSLSVTKRPAAGYRRTRPGRARPASVPPTPPPCRGRRARWLSGRRWLRIPSGAFDRGHQDRRRLSRQKQSPARASARARKIAVSVHWNAQ